MDQTFEPGQIVRVRPGKTSDWLTEGENYLVVEAYENLVSVRSPSGRQASFYPWRFTAVPTVGMAPPMAAASPLSGPASDALRSSAQKLRDEAAKLLAAASELEALIS